jgi:hypothetical protein
VLIQLDRAVLGGHSAGMPSNCAAVLILAESGLILRLRRDDIRHLSPTPR